MSSKKDLQIYAYELCQFILNILFKNILSQAHELISFSLFLFARYIVKDVCVWDKPIVMALWEFLQLFTLPVSYQRELHSLCKDVTNCTNH